MRGEGGWSSPLGMKLEVGQGMNMGISSRSEAHCFYFAMVRNSRRAWDFALQFISLETMERTSMYGL